MLGAHQPCDGALTSPEELAWHKAERQALYRSTWSDDQLARQKAAKKLTHKKYGAGYRAESNAKKFLLNKGVTLPKKPNTFIMTPEGRQRVGKITRHKAVKGQPKDLQRKLRKRTRMRNQPRNV